MLRSLYRLQTRLGLTGPEGSALLILALALTLGLGLSEWRSQQAPPVAELYAAQDAAFSAALVVPSAEAATVPAALVSLSEDDSASTDLPSLADGALPPDTVHVEEPSAPAEPAFTGPVTNAPRRSNRKVLAVTNVNTASAEQMQSNLPGIGPAMSARVVEYRRQHGSFRSVEQMIEIRGIGEKTLEKLRPWVRL